MQSSKIFYVTALLWVSPLFGWARHNLITEAVLKKMVLPEASVVYVPLAEALGTGLSRVQARTIEAFLTELKLYKGYSFPTNLNESAGRIVFVNNILSTYSDEPDWGPDTNLFEADQYPELWNDDMQYVSKRSGTGSGGFRHMFFPGKYHWEEPIMSFQIPMIPLGEAPARAQLFWEISQDMFRHNQPYWGYRFLAWAFHYIEDLHQPFHTRQVPSLSFIRWRLKWFIFPTFDVPRTADQIEYYHLSYEEFITHRGMDELREELLSDELAPKIEGPLQVYIQDKVVPFSSSHATKVGELSSKLFPALNVAAGQPVDSKIGSQEWWKALSPGDEGKQLIGETHELFKEMGKVIRRLVADSH